MILYTILHDRKDWVFVESFLIQWAIKSDISATANERIGKLFPSTFSTYIRHKAPLETFITNLLNHDDYRAHHLLSDLAHELMFHKIIRLNLDLNILNKLEFEDILYICRKLMGYIIIEADLISSLIFSIFDKNSIDQRTKQLIIDIFSQYLGKDYPKIILEFCNEIISSGNNLSIKIETANIIVESIKKYLAELNSLPHLKELSLSSNQTYQIKLEESREMTDLMEKASEESILQQLATKIPLKYGKSWFNYQHGKYTQPSFLSSFSHSVDVPGSLITHPVSAEMQRITFRMKKRVEK